MKNEIKKKTIKTLRTGPETHLRKPFNEEYVFKRQTEGEWTNVRLKCSRNVPSKNGNRINLSKLNTASSQHRNIFHQEIS